MSEVIWRKLKTIEQIMLENPGLENSDDYGIDIILIHKSKNIHWTINDEMYPMFGDNEEYAFRNRHKSVTEYVSYTHYLDIDAMEHDRFNSTWVFHELWFTDEDDIELIQFTDEEFKI